MTLKLITLALAALLAVPALGQAAPEDAAHRALDYLASLQQPDGRIGATSDAAWSAIAFARAGRPPSELRHGGASLCDAVLADTLPDMTETSLARQMLAVSACGLDVRTALPFDPLAELRSRSDGTQVGNPCLLNDDVFALQALAAAGVPNDDALVAQERAVVLANQQPGGGWSFATLDPIACPDSTAFGLVFTDVDTTSAGLVALLHTGSSGTDPAILRGIAYIKLGQGVDGGCSGGLLNQAVGLAFDASALDLEQAQRDLGSNADSTSWGVMGLHAAGQDPAGPLWTLPADHNLVNYLLTLQAQDGRFAWEPGNPGFSPLSTTAWAATALLGHDFVA
ncbi:MAG: hypothetical protein LC624_09120 [Halobacteriales archaeon]|nr:hypothetical protein [Halobacteriales archaeon]